MKKYITTLLALSSLLAGSLMAGNAPVARQLSVSEMESVTGENAYITYVVRSQTDSRVVSIVKCVARTTEGSLTWDAAKQQWVSPAPDTMSTVVLNVPASSFDSVVASIQNAPNP